MKLLLFFFGATFVIVIKGQTDCDYDYVCSDLGSKEDLTMTSDSPLACYTACEASRDIGGDRDCLFWTYYEELGYRRSFDEENDAEQDSVDGKLRANGKAVCRKLIDCDTTFDISACGSTVGGEKCASGPGSCEACDMCDPLTYKAGSAVAHWTCNVDLPYRKTAFAPDTICRTECPSTLWAGNFAQAICESACPAVGPGTWTLTTTANDGTSDVTPTLDSACPCEDIVLGAHQLPASTSNGATSEAGARFYCDAPLNPDGNDDLNTMDSTSKCQLLCNGHIAMDIKCIAGSWTAGVITNEDIYCWGPPLECDYNPGVNGDVCTCADGAGTTNICAAGEGCQADGTCLAACTPDPTPIAVDGDCFCETPLGGGLCAAGSTCDGGKCT